MIFILCNQKVSYICVTIQLLKKYSYYGIRTEANG
ncbi:hypothetical protein SAMN05421747_102353 [Parapedobacter composti]|uniref:Uncharacterized protein n=1 Tax=Parapedobacter composti TaxID=623281 RepID=A0A1I1FBH9_9SPHI|nr:hypothetical protein SAMN05421747_102353 [Parapedobacter composti]